jgi:molecular chaperone Hsp33
MLRNFSQDDRDHMVENGVITVTCEFCSSVYKFEPGEVASQDANASQGDKVS